MPQGTIDGSQFLIRGPLGHWRSWRGQQPIISEEDRAGFEQGQVISAATEITYGCGEQTREQGGAEVGTCLRQRIEHLVQAAALVVRQAYGRRSIAACGA